MHLTPQEVKAITERRLAASRADGCIVHVRGGDKVNLRFARNSATSNGAHSDISIAITSQFGQQSGSASVSSLDEDALNTAQRRSEEIARHAPADPEHLPPLGAQSYAEGIAFDPSTADIKAKRLAEAASGAIDRAKSQSVEAAGYTEAGASFAALSTSNGLFAYERASVADLTVTARRSDGSWSGWAGGSDFRFGALDSADIARRAVGKAAHGGPPLDLDPGAYTVILEPAATGELLRYLIWSLDAREADEGQSWLSAKGGGTRLGETLFDPRVTLYSDPAEALAPAALFDHDGMPRRRTVWAENGAIRRLAYSRFWAAKTGNQPLPSPTDMVMIGGDTPIEAMIQATRRGILVTRVWYTNMLDPRTLLITGLTRDGNFLIENGRIVGPVCNLRFNESLIGLLANIDAVGPTERIHGGDLSGGAVAAPPLLVKTFTFTSRSSGI
jgi:predicted Zn-dependent protease